jgi:RNA-directed DNA polymerase
MKIQLTHKYNDIICVNNLFLAWNEFVVGKRSKQDVQEFSRNLIDNILALHESLVNKTYRHGGYHSFYINDPKRRHIHKASVEDRLLHHAIYRLLYPFFEKTFIHDSYSCRLGKGVYKAIERFDKFSYKVGKNDTKTVWVLKCDIRKFFDSIDHEVLFNILKNHIPDKDILWLLNNVIDSYHNENKHKVGLPLGNLTSQLFANVYMNVFDQWVKHNLKAQQYIRYADDFVFFGTDKIQLNSLIESVRLFLLDELNLTLHPKKISQKTLSSGIDFLGWVHFLHYKKLRRKTKERMFRKLIDKPKDEVFQSYLGFLSHGNTWKIEKELRNFYWLLCGVV